jgi:hypothetical protein
MGWCSTWGGVRHGVVFDMGWCSTWGGVRHGVVFDMGVHGLTWLFKPLHESEFNSY